MLKQVQHDNDLFARFEIPKQVRNDRTTLAKIRSSVLRFFHPVILKNPQQTCNHKQK